MTRPAFIAIDWGTTNRRAYLVGADGTVLDRAGDGPGVSAMAAEDYAPAIAAMRARLGDLPVLAAGMVGSTRGWREAPYVDAPAGLSDLSARLLDLGGRVHIVPGVAVTAGGRADVMRGEEVQLLGAVASGLAPADATLLQPGTHAKWVAMEGGRIAGFHTRMTGELYALLRDHSVLRDMMQVPAAPGPAFLDAVAVRGQDLLAELFGVRPAVLLGRLPPDDGAARISGLLIGAEIAAAGPAAARVHLLSEGPLADLYEKALTSLGHMVSRVDSHAAFVAGMSRIWEGIR